MADNLDGPPVSGRGLLAVLSFLGDELERVDLDDFTLDEIRGLEGLMLPIISKLARTVSDSLDRYQARRAALEALWPALCSAGWNLGDHRGRMLDGEHEADRARLVEQRRTLPGT